MPLSMAPEGKENVICKIGGKEETRLFLERLGFVVGAIVTVISEIQGNLIVNVKDSRVAIGKDIPLFLLFLILDNIYHFLSQISILKPSLDVKNFFRFFQKKLWLITTAFITLQELRLARTWPVKSWFPKRNNVHLLYTRSRKGV